MERYFILSESQLRRLLIDEMETFMCQTDGVDNWREYGSSFQDTKEYFAPIKIQSYNDILDIKEMTFDDIAQMRIDAGEFKEFKE